MYWRLLMAEKMENICRVWDTGHLQAWESSESKDSLKRTEAFCEKTGASRVVKLSWYHEGKQVFSPFPASVLPDQSGVVLMDEWHFQGQPMEGPEPYPRHLRVFSPNGSLRLRIYPPSIDEHSRPQSSWIECPRAFPHHGIPFGSPASDGHHNMVIEYDWQTGQMLRWIDASPWLDR
jgi:hypothetical protein